MSLAYITILVFSLLIGTAVYSFKKEPQICHWQKCGQINGEPINCEAEEIGTHEELGGVVSETKSGSVVWRCE